RRVALSGGEVRRALEPPVSRIVSAVKDTLERTPPELAADLGVRGIVLAGGGSLLRGIDERLRSEVGLPVQLVESPLTCVAEGAGRPPAHAVEGSRGMRPAARPPVPRVTPRPPRRRVRSRR